MTMTSKRVDYLYDLMDSAYDTNAIVDHCRAQGRVPVVAFHPRRATRRPSEVPKVRPPKQVPEMDWAKRERYAERTMVERVNARLKDEFGGRHIRVRGGVKVMAHLMFGLIAITADQLLRQLS
jgi:IS5 family transposase